MHGVIDRAHAWSDVAHSVTDRAHSIKVAVNFRACARSELLKWIGRHLWWHYVI